MLRPSIGLTILSVSICGFTTGLAQGNDQEGAATISVQKALSAPTPLTKQPGDPLRGKRVIQDNQNASCLLCHTINQIDAPFQGNIGPDLSDIGERYTAAQLRFRLLNPYAINPDTPMPGYGKIQQWRQAEPQYQGKSVYSPQDIEDVVAFLQQLKEP